MQVFCFSNVVFKMQAWNVLYASVFIKYQLFLIYLRIECENAFLSNVKSF